MRTKNLKEPRHGKHQERGFSLIELIFVAAIVSILAALAIPYIQKARIATNEAASLATLRTILEAETLYNSRFATHAPLADLVGAEFIDDSLADATKSGYQFTVQNLSATDFELIVMPVDFGVSGEKSYFVDASGVIRFTSDGTVPGPGSPTLGQ